MSHFTHRILWLVNDADAGTTRLKCFYCCRYEDEINKRAAVENEFVLLKKVKAFSQITTVLFLIYTIIFAELSPCKGLKPY